MSFLFIWISCFAPICSRKDYYITSHNVFLWLDSYTSCRNNHAVFSSATTETCIHKDYGLLGIDTSD